MNTIMLDKIGSATYNLDLDQEIGMSDAVVAEEGAVVIVEVLEDKKTYNQLELPSGRLSTLKKGDIVAVALGNRRALKGFVGSVPESLNVGEVIHFLNLGGVAGICSSENLKEVGHALRAKVLGAAVRDGKTLNIKDAKRFSEKDTLESKIPLVIVSGTCMNVGKTTTTCEIIKQMFHARKKVSGAKLAGVAALRDTEKMRDYGAKKVVSFIDAGYPSTVDGKERPVGVAKGAIDYLSLDCPDYIVIEFGDGIYGEYGVLDILKDPQIQAAIIAHIGCAHDPVGAVKLAEVCREIGAPLHAVSGPVTDNSVGCDFIHKNLNLPAFNALYQGAELFTCLEKICLQK
ncbi:hypothetical protein HZA43_01085 [Candidatus Peregrinibacteria bacterium]|nr:hypothetical protein [Candidatus Peregrinibacteria bacterium]